MFRVIVKQTDKDHAVHPETRAAPGLRLELSKAGEKRKATKRQPLFPLRSVVPESSGAEVMRMRKFN